MKFHDELNPKLWDKNNEEYTLKEEVKAKLEEIATAFIEYLDIPTDSILDKVITGSSASYNYTEFSDLDLHIIVDFDKVHKDCPVVEGYLSAMKSTFNKQHDIFIHGVPVELYAEKKDQGTVHNGLYSLQTGWIDIPNKIEPTNNDAAVEAKYNELKELIDKCETAEVADEILDKIYTMRKAGLADAGEFSTENLAFKKLRNEGVMNKLRQLKKQEVDKQLSLESYNEGLNEIKIDTVNKAQKASKLRINDLDKQIANLNAKKSKELKRFSKFTKTLDTRKGDGYYIDIYNDFDDSPLSPLCKRYTNEKEALDIFNSLNTEQEWIHYTNNNKPDFPVDNVMAVSYYKVYNNRIIKQDIKFFDDWFKNRWRNEVAKNESVNEESQLDKETELAQKLIDICEKMGFEVVQDRFDWIDLGNGIHIQVWTGSVTVVDYNTGDEKELPLETEEDLQNIIQTANKLSNKNESIKEDTYMDKYKPMYDKATELAQDRAKIDFVSKMNPQDLVNYAVKAIKRNDANISDVENMLNKANYTPGQIEDLLDMIRTNLDEAYYRKRNKCASIREEVTDMTKQDIDNVMEILKNDKKYFYDNHISTHVLYLDAIKKRIPELMDLTDTEVGDILSNLGYPVSYNPYGTYDNFVADEKMSYEKFNKWIDHIPYMVNESIKEEIGEFSTVTDFNYPEEFKQDLEKYRKEYEVVDQIEGKDLLHLVYDNGKHIATFNNTKLQKYSESVNEDYEWHGPVAKVTFDNGDVIETAINGTDEEIKSYYMGKTFNLGKEEDDMHKVVKVEVIRESVEDVHSNFKSMAKRIVRDFKIKGYPKSNKFYMDFAKEAVAGFKKDWGYDVKIATGNGELILTLEDTYQAVIDAQTHKIKFSDLENSNYMFENKKEEREMKHKNEGMWASPFTVKNAKKVAKLLANPITLGELNSEEKQKELWNVIGDDQFWDDVIEEATAEPDCDARPLIISNLEHWIENKENFNDDAYYQAAEDIITKAIAKFNNNLKKLRESKNIYKPSTILKALDIERNWYKEIGLSADEKAPQVMFFIIDNDEIKDTKLVDRQDVYTYKPQANEYYLDRLRDTGFDLTDYNLSHVQKMVDSWNEGKKFEDVDSLCDKIDNANSDLKLLIKSLAPAKNPVVESINKCLAEALEEEIWGVEMFLDTVDGDPEPGHVEFTRDSLIDFLNDYGYELSKDASDEEIKECAEDYEMTIKYIRKPN